MKFFTIILLFITLCVSQWHSATVRTLTNSAGAKIEAEITGIWQGKVTFARISDKKSFTIPINSLVQADRDFLDQRIHLLTLPPPDSGFANGAVIVADARRKLIQDIGLPRTKGPKPSNVWVYEESLVLMDGKWRPPSLLWPTST